MAPRAPAGIVAVMREGISGMGWFAALRRDRALFALVATLAFSLQLLQPLAAASLAEGRVAGAICTLAHADGTGDLPSAWPDECPVCLAGAPCSGKLPAHGGAVLPGALFGLQTTAATLAWPPAAGPTQPGTPAPSPAIRAPPPSA
jgi:hypothetical protein